MTYAAHDRDWVAYLGSKGPTDDEPAADSPGFLRRIFNGIFESRQQQADRDIARFLARSGGRLTDDMEREMTQRLFKGDWNVH